MSTLLEFKISGMDCPSCGAGIERALHKAGLKDARIDFSKHLLKVTPNPDFPPSRIISRVSELGFKADPNSNAINEASKEATTINWQILICILFTIPLLGHMIVPWHVLHNPTVQMLLATPVMIVGLSRFGRSAIKSLQSGYPNMDTLIVLGSSSAFIYSIIGIFIQRADQHLFFETAASIITIVLIGNLLERRSLAKMNDALSSFNQKVSITARKILPNGEIDEIPQEAIVVGDKIHLRTGDLVPVDGTVVEGAIDVDQAILTGEATPITKQIGDSVIGGSTAYGGSAIIEATAIGSSSVLSGVIKLIDTAQTRKPAIQRMGDFVSAIFTPTVLTITVITVIICWNLGLDLGESLIRGVAILVIACPCAMGLATPTAVAIGLGRGAKSGVLVKGGDLFERLAEVDAVVFDKTGTLTTGRFRVTNFTSSGIDLEQARSIIRTLEEISIHPIARSISDCFADAVKAELYDIREIPGKGVEGRDASGIHYFFGARTIDATSGRSNISLTRNDVVVASLELEDEIDPESSATLSELQALGYKVFLVSGDSAQRCRELANSLRFDDIYYEQSPSQKLETISKLQSLYKVAFVGDGVNDGPALAQANVGISISEATQLAIQSADVVILGRSLRKIPSTLLLGRTTLRTIKENLFWAFSYNLIAIPLAAFGYLTPIVGAFAMAFSDVMTIGNSLRLKGRPLLK